MRQRLLPIFSRYAAVGVISVALNNIILIAGDALGLHYVASTLACFFVIGGLAYLAHTNITFEVSRSLIGYLRYCATQVTTLALTLGMLHIAIDQLAWSIWIAAPIVSVAMLLFNFIATRWAVIYPTPRRSRILER